MGIQNVPKKKRERESKAQGKPPCCVEFVFCFRHSHSSMDVLCGHRQVPWEASWIIVFATGPMTGMTTPTKFPSESQVKAFRIDLRCSGKSMKSQLCSADREHWLKPITVQRALQRALRVRRQRHACVQGGASSLGCGVTIMIARTRGLASRPVARNSRNDCTGLTRSAVFLIFLIDVHAVGNLHVTKGPGDFNVYGCFYHSRKKYYMQSFLF